MECSCSDWARPSMTNKSPCSKVCKCGRVDVHTRRQCNTRCGRWRCGGHSGAECNPGCGPWLMYPPVSKEMFRTLINSGPKVTPARAVKFLLNKQIAKVILRMSIGNWCCGDSTCCNEGKRQTLTATKQHTCLQPDPGCITKLHSIPPSTLLHGSRGM